MPLYSKPVRLLMHEFVENNSVLSGQVIHKSEVMNWFQTYYPKIKKGTIEGHLVRSSTNSLSRIHHKLTKDGLDDLFFRLDANHFRLYERETDPSPIYDTTDNPDNDSIQGRGLPMNQAEGEKTSDSEFAYEHDLRDFLAQNLPLIEPGLKLYNDEGLSGIEFPVGNRFIDLLAVDAQGRLVVIELKVSKGYDRVVGQLLRYIGWLDANPLLDTQEVRGIIIAKSISEDLKLACARLEFVKLFQYSLSVSLEIIE